jgi:hypothetical protein
MKCENCGRNIKNIYHFDGKVYGIECWKIIALPEIEKRRKAKFELIEKENYLKSSLYIQVLMLKDWSKITSSFKQNFATSVEKQFKDKGFLTWKQRDAISTWLFNGKDWKNLYRLEVESGLQDKKDLINSGVMSEKDF